MILDVSFLTESIPVNKFNMFERDFPSLEELCAYRFVPVL